jgi:hypothetical protein
MNMHTDEDATIIIRRNDYRKPYLDLEAQAQNKAKDEEIEALRAQIAQIQGKPRPRPPRPDLN